MSVFLKLLSNKFDASFFNTEKHQSRRGRLSWCCLIFLCFWVGCGSSISSEYRSDSGRDLQIDGRESVVLVATERFDRGGRLVGISVDGARRTELTKLHGDRILDRSPVVSPDGRWVVFVSNRGRERLSETSLWRVPLGGGPVERMTAGDFSDRDPRISPDGEWLYFCSNRKGRFALYRSKFARESGEIGAPRVVVESGGQVLSPGISPDGRSVVYMQVEDDGRSRIWRAPVVSSRGARLALTEGPGDMTPSWGPGGKIAFSARAQLRDDADVFLMNSDGSGRVSVASTPITDETGPRFSATGRYLFAIGMYSSVEDGKPLLGSVIALDRRAPKPQWRALHDPAAVETRVGLGLTRALISAPNLQKNPEYIQALKKVLQDQVRRNESQQSHGIP